MKKKDIAAKAPSPSVKDEVQVSKKAIRRAGDIFRSRMELSTAEQNEAIDIINKYRQLFNVPLNAFQMTLRHRIQSLKLTNSIVAQRLKRLPTIIFKLQLNKTMQLDTMQDIGGARAIVNNIKDLKSLHNAYLNSKTKFTHSLEREYDYIEKPKDSGYRGYHMVFKYKGTTEKQKKYEGLRIELQLRTHLQHVWATAVETFEFFLGDKFKSSLGDPKWLEFFALVSSLFALEEKQNVVERHRGLSKEMITQKIREIMHELDVFKWLTTISKVSYDAKKFRGNRKAYCLLVLDTEKHDTSIYIYDKYARAYEAYSKWEYGDDKMKTEQVLLLRMDHINKATAAYPNFFANLKEFTQILQKIMSAK